MFANLKNMRIQKRLKTSYNIVIALAGLASLVGIVVMFIMTSRYDHTLTNYAFPQGDIGLAMTELAEIRSATRAVIGYEQQSAMDKEMANHDQSVEELDKLLAAIEVTMVTPEGRQSFAAIQGALEEYYVVEAEVLKIGYTTDKALSAKAQAMDINNLTPAYDAVGTAFMTLMDVNVEKGDGQHKLLSILRYVVLVIMIAIIVAAVLVATRIGELITRSISNPIDELVVRLDAFSEGDISSPFPECAQDDEIADMAKAIVTTTTKLQVIIKDMESLLEEMAEGNFNIRTSCEEEYIGEFNGLLMAIRRMNRQIDATLREVKEASDMVSAGASNLAEASQELAEGATDQASSVEEMQATVSEVTSGLHQAVKEIQISYDNAKNCAKEAEQSQSEMQVMMRAMAQINDTSHKIGQIISEIEDIASQTNLLSLNAAIEAARAGDAGAGFAVVAEQIRNLAEQSARSAVNTRELIEGSMREVEIGNQAACRTSEVLENVVASIQNIADTSKMLSEVAANQAEAMEQADQGIDKIAGIVESNSATAEETSATSEELSAQAISMDDLVGRFVLREE